MSKKRPEYWMSRAIELSKLGFPAPNPHVGCVIVRDGRGLGEGFHDHAGGPHAEIVALMQAGESARGAETFVTLEPCNHWGRTGPCSEALISAGVTRVTYAVPDPNLRAQGGGERLKEAGIEVHSGLLQTEAEIINDVFLTAMRRGSPYVTLKAAITSDGYMATPDGKSKWITGKEARATAHLLRAQMGAVAVGAGTVLIDNPFLTVRRLPGHSEAETSRLVANQPVRILLDAESAIDINSRVFHEAGEVLHLVGHQTGPNQQVLPLQDGQFDLVDLLGMIWSKGITSVLIEGGPKTLARFYQERLFDRLDLFVSSRVFGSGLTFLPGFDKEAFVNADGLKLQRRATVGEDEWLTFYPVLPNSKVQT
jgi:diaminohydroxyphosphoribosylaminopyrimidine deaminase/5-amino-6-(5-phosphoribosylamino)uracil reductase